MHDAVGRPIARPSLRLCLASLRYHPEYAGPAVRFRRYAPGLADRGVRMSVFTAWTGATDEAPSGGEGSLLPVEQVDGVDVHRVQVQLKRGRSQMYRTYERALVDHCRESRPHVVQLLTVTPGSLPRLLNLRRAGIPLVYTHTMVDTAVESDLIAQLKSFHRTLPLRLIDCVVVSSGVMRDALRREGVTGRIDVIPNGVDLSRFRPSGSAAVRASLRERLGLPLTGELIVFVGGFLKERKGIDLLAEAWRLFARSRPSAHLILVGPKHDGLRPQGPQAAFHEGVMRSLSASEALDRVHFTGPVENVESYLQAADLFVFPSRKEGMPNVVAEAYGTGTPCILMPFLGLPAEFGRPGKEYFLVDHDPSALAFAISQVLDSPRTRERLTRFGLMWARKHLDVERSLDRYAELYRELAGSLGTSAAGGRGENGARTRDRWRSIGSGASLRTPG